MEKIKYKINYNDMFTFGYILIKCVFLKVGVKPIKLTLYAYTEV